MVCGPSSVLLLGDPPVVERIKLLFSTILSSGSIIRTGLWGLPQKLLPFTLKPDHSESHADEGEGDTYRSHWSEVEQRAGQLTVHLFVGYICWALTLCWA